MTETQMQAREDKWAELINLVNLGDITLAEANRRFDEWVVRTEND